MLQWLCHDRGLCAVVGLPLWSGSLVALVLIVVAVISFCSRLRCSQMLAGAARQDDIEAFHPKIFDRCGGEHGGFL